MQALLPVIREMGMPSGHARQSSLEARLVLIAAAPWKDNAGMDTLLCTALSMSSLSHIMLLSRRLWHRLWHVYMQAPLFSCFAQQVRG